MIIALLLALAAATAADPPRRQAISAAAAPAPPAAHRRCTATRRLLIGGWHMDISDEPPSEIFPDGDSRDWQFAVEGGRPIWREWLHYRPGADGQWTLTGCRLMLSYRGGGREDYSIVRLTRTQLWLRATGESSVERWTRIPNRR